MSPAFHPFESAVQTTIERHGMLDESGRVLCAVSGGADSVSLALALGRLAIPMGIAHFDHRWRGAESREDRNFVRNLASTLGVPFHEGRASDPSGPTSEAGARRERLGFLDQTAERESYTRIALAHTRTDRSETFLLNLVRGAGSDGLTSMRPVSGVRIRPLIEVSRDDVEQYLVGIGQSWRDDSSNFDSRYARNRLRHGIIPDLEALNPRLEETLARTITLLDDENTWMHDEAAEWLAPRLGRDPDGMVLRIDDLATRPRAMIRRILRQIIAVAQAQLGASSQELHLRNVGFEHIEAVRGLLEAGKSGRMVEIPGPVRVERSFDTLRFVCGPTRPFTYDRDLTIPGVLAIPEIGRRLEARILPSGETTISYNSNPDRVFVDGDSVGACVSIRNWQKGDRYNPTGMKATSLKALFEERRVPWRRRLEWPVVVAGSSIVWAASFPVSRDFAATADSRETVELVFLRL